MTGSQLHRWSLSWRRVSDYVSCRSCGMRQRLCENYRPFPHSPECPQAGSGDNPWKSLSDIALSIEASAASTSADSLVSGSNIRC